MENRNLFDNLSPIDHRYYLSNSTLFDELALYLSEKANIRYCILAEIALLKTHINLQLGNNPKLIEIVDSLVDKISVEEVYVEEEKTQHNIRALVNVIKSKVDSNIRHFVHLGATSVDILDTSTSMRIRDAVRKVILPLLLDIEEVLIRVAESEATTPQVGRTHGQHAVPITFGFAIAEYIARLGKSIEKIEILHNDLRGKLSGAVGAYNSTSMIVKDPMLMEEIYLNYLGLKPAEYSTQMVEPEFLLRLLLEINIAFGIIANLADDLRHLQRSEINEIREFFSNTQVGSSTMPQKRNPWNSEHVKSLWKAFAPRVMTFFMDQISEHQRDLSNSASARFISDYLAGFTAASARMKKILNSLFVDRDTMKKNLKFTDDLILSEAAYILLSVSGEGDAHEKIRLFTLNCEKNGTKLIDEIKTDAIIWEKISSKLFELTGIEANQFFSNPELYKGKAVEKSIILSEKYKKVVNQIRGRL